MTYEQVLKETQGYYGNTEASYHFAAERYATIKMIEENKLILENTSIHLGVRDNLVILSRIYDLEQLLNKKC